GITFVVNLVAIVAFTFGSGIWPRLEWFLVIPLFAELFVLVFGIGLILSTLYVRFRDVAQIWELLSQLLFYASPIIYPVTVLPDWAKPIAFVNPFVQIMQDVRAVIDAPDAVPTAAHFLGGSAGRLIPIGVGMAIFAVGVVLFRRESPFFAERV
ncbi:MAG: ABC transporter permease, partial [Actinomycetota bacterium]|nr:ABC transporter permease [Actinomycetota bacterium]